jgi:hypothetical protein
VAAGVVDGTNDLTASYDNARSAASERLAPIFARFATVQTAASAQRGGVPPRSLSRRERKIERGLQEAAAQGWSVKGLPEKRHL